MLPKLRLFSPTSPPPERRSRRKVPDWLRDNEFDSLLAWFDGAIIAAADGKRPFYTARLVARDRLLVHLGLYCGLRVSEMSKLRIENVDLDGKVLKVRGKGDKDRFIRIHPRLLPLLAEWIGDRTAGFAFLGLNGQKLSVEAIRLRMYAVGAAVNLRFRLKPHSLRHSAATRLLKRCRNLKIVQEFLGHADLKTTQIYCHATAEEVAEAVDKM